MGEMSRSTLMTTRANLSWDPTLPQGAEPRNCVNGSKDAALRDLQRDAGLRRRIAVLRLP